MVVNRRVIMDVTGLVNHILGKGLVIMEVNVKILELVLTLIADVSGRRKIMIDLVALPMMKYLTVRELGGTAAKLYKINKNINP
ncbi:MAG: hypothetical protein ACLFTQ_00800 [Candidatus Aenigmatarchaeota archaeon]